MARCLLAFGANLGDRRQSLEKALELVAASDEVRLLARSSWHETVAVGGPAGQADYLNGAALVDTSLSPGMLAESIHQIEERLGRERKIRWDARILDVDLLLYGDQIIDDVNLQVPHPRMAFRQFVLAPVVEIAGHLIHPTTGWTLAALLSHWRTGPRRVAIAGFQAEDARWLRDAIVQELNAEARDRGASEPVELVSIEQKPSMIMARGGLQVALELSNHKGLTIPEVKLQADTPAEILHEALAAIQAAWPE